MAKLKKAYYSFTNSANATVAIDTDILIDSAGIFYAHIPDRMKMAFNQAIIDHREKRAGLKDGWCGCRPGEPGMALLRGLRALG